jgi:hypothetical protein
VLKCVLTYVGTVSVCGSVFCWCSVVYSTSLSDSAAVSSRSIVPKARDWALNPGSPTGPVPPHCNWAGSKKPVWSSVPCVVEGVGVGRGAVVVGTGTGGSVAAGGGAGVAARTAARGR